MRERAREEREGEIYRERGWRRENEGGREWGERVRERVRKRE